MTHDPAIQVVMLIGISTAGGSMLLGFGMAIKTFMEAWGWPFGWFASPEARKVVHKLRQHPSGWKPIARGALLEHHSGLRLAVHSSTESRDRSVVHFPRWWDQVYVRAAKREWRANKQSRTLVKVR